LLDKGYYGQNTFFAGRLWDGSTGIFIRDKKGKTRIRLYVNDEGTTVFELVDKDGKTTDLTKLSSQE